MWNARALHKLCFPQRGWEQKAYTHTHIEKETTWHTRKHRQIREMEEDKKERSDRDRKTESL